MGDWQSIETAPLDGTVFLAASPAGIYDGIYRGGSVVPCSASEWRTGVEFSDLSDCDRDGGHLSVWPAPTHWMPLPEAPQ